MKKGHMPSLVACIVKNHTMVRSYAYGYYKFYREENTTEDIIYPIGSVTKSFTATVIMQLNETGIIGLDDNVSKYLNFDLKNPKYPNVNITFRMLLAHQSSLSDVGNRFSFYFGYLNYSRDNLNEYFLPNGSIYSSKVWKDYPPGENVCYSTVGFEIIGYIIEQITEQSLEDYYKENIFEPLNMMNTSFYFSNFDKNRIIVPYTWIAGIYFPLPRIKEVIFAGGGLKTTVLDLSHYLIMHTNGGVYNGVRILKEESVAEMHRIQYQDSPDGNVVHGLGWYSSNTSGEEYGGHMGGAIGAQASMILRYSDNVGIIFLWNQNPPILKFVLDIWREEEDDARRQIGKALFEKADEL